MLFIQEKVVRKAHRRGGSTSIYMEFVEHLRSRSFSNWAERATDLSGEKLFRIRQSASSRTNTFHYHLSVFSTEQNRRKHPVHVCERNTDLFADRAGLPLDTTGLTYSFTQRGWHGMKQNERLNVSLSQFAVSLPPPPKMLNWPVKKRPGSSLAATTLLITVVNRACAIPTD